MSKPKTEKTAEKPGTSPKTKSRKKPETKTKTKPKKETKPKKGIKPTKKPDWEKIRTEYITGELSYQRLASKYKVSFNTLKGRARREGWGKERTQSREKVAAAARKKIERQKASKTAKEAADLFSVAEKILDKIALLVEEENIDEKKIKALTGALRDIKDIQGEKTDNQITVVISEEAKEWAE